jgi:hypothetical protein
MYTEGTVIRPPSAQGLADIGGQANEIFTRVVAQGTLSGPAALPATRAFAALRWAPGSDIL